MIWVMRQECTCNALGVNSSSRGRVAQADTCVELLCLLLFQLYIWA
jgi:hypothetical protein